MMRTNHTLSADYYSLGIIAYEFMQGSLPYDGTRKEIRMLLEADKQV
jgi:serine/threonine protein kinase